MARRAPRRASDPAGLGRPIDRDHIPTGPAIPAPARGLVRQDLGRVPKTPLAHRAAIQPPEEVLFVGVGSDAACRFPSRGTRAIP